MRSTCRQLVRRVAVPRNFTIWWCVIASQLCDHFNRDPNVYRCVGKRGVWAGKSCKWILANPVSFLILRPISVLLQCESVFLRNVPQWSSFRHLHIPSRLATLSWGFAQKVASLVGRRAAVCHSTSTRTDSLFVRMHERVNFKCPMSFNAARYM